MANRVCFVFVKLAVVSAFVVTMVVAGCGGESGSGGSGSTDAGGSVPGGGADGGTAPVAGDAGDGGGFQIWISVASSADGTKLVAVSNGNINYNNINNLGYIYTSADYGVTWKQTGPQTNWTSVASSADGTKLVAAAIAYTVDGREVSSDDPLVGGGLYTSSDSGATWTLTGSSPNLLSPDWSQGSWYSVASSTDGTKLVAWGIERICTSVDSGATWTPAALPFVLTVSGSVASSADGAKLIAVSGGGAGTPGPIYTSADSGATWTPRTLSTQLGALQWWTSVASSADGTKLVATAAAGAAGVYYPITTAGNYTSADSGATWAWRGYDKNQWLSVASSADGTKLVAGAGVGYIYTSSDYGATWTQTTAPVATWLSVASSADGTKLVAAADAGYIYTSSDSGATWTQRGW